MTDKTLLQRRIRYLLVFFMCALTVSGLTAIPLQWELRVLMPLIEQAARWGLNFPPFSQWVVRINDAMVSTRSLRTAPTGWHLDTSRSRWRLSAHCAIPSKTSGSLSSE
jgi:hypothetical protein